jgi:prefoldin subunit 5
LQEELQELASRHTTLRASVDDYTENMGTVSSAKDIEYAEKLIRKIDKLGAGADDFATQTDTLHSSIEAYTTQVSIKRSAEDDIKRYVEEELPELEQELPSACPLCGKELG